MQVNIKNKLEKTRASRFVRSREKRFESHTLLVLKYTSYNFVRSVSNDIFVAVYMFGLKIEFIIVEYKHGGQKTA